MTGDGVYAPTLHWGIARDGFESVVTIYNYLGFAFRNEPPVRTDAVVEIRLHDGEGASAGALDAEIATGGTLHLPLSRIRAGFQGAVTVAMRPKGRMARLSWCDGKAHRPIATSFFMLYRRAGFADFSHELFTVRADRDSAPAEWATVLFTDGSIDPSVIVMNNRIGCNGDGYGSDVAMRLYDLAGAPQASAYFFNFSSDPRYDFTACPTLTLLRDDGAKLTGTFGQIPPFGARERSLTEMFGEAARPFLAGSAYATLIAEQPGVTLGSIHLIRNRARGGMSIEHTRPTHMYVT